MTTAIVMLTGIAVFVGIITAWDLWQGRRRSTHKGKL